MAPPRDENTLTRAEIEKKIEPIIERCRRLFAPGSSDAHDSPPTQETLRPEIRRVSLIVSLAQSVLDCGVGGEGLEVGSGYGYLLLPMASVFPNIRWSAIDHPGPLYATRQKYRSIFRDNNCELVIADLTREALPFPDGHFSVVTFSEVLEHLPPERLSAVLSEIARLIRPGGVLIASSPNQASLENRLRLLRGRSILEMPEELEHAKGIFGHIRLYTPAEMQSAMAKLGFALERCVIESNNSGYRGGSDRSWRRRIYRMYEHVEGKVGMLRGLGDTWYMAFRKTARIPANLKQI
jgi:2-polyprenyl-3-methyl-5-hydroxy-6-metoxy-1,4-benzoquinol methylase